MKRIVFIVIILMLVVPSVASCGGNLPADRSDHSEFQWPSGELPDLLPVPEQVFGRIKTNTEDEFEVEIGRINEERFNEYVRKCQEKGFSVNADNIGATIYRANNADGYALEVWFMSSYGYMTITVEVPINAREFQWPRSEIAQLIDPPKSNRGRIEWEASYGFVIYVGNTTKADYDDYVNSCADRGFTVDYRKGDDFYYAYNADGYYLTLSYEGSDVMFIRLDEPDEVYEPSEVDEPDGVDTGESDIVVESDEENTTSPSSATSNENNNSSSAGSTTPWREFLEEYEAWVDTYIEFMEKYNANPSDTSLLTDYLTLATEYLEWVEKAENVEDDLSGEDLRLYLEAMTRISQKLLAVAQ